MKNALYEQEQAWLAKQIGLDDVADKISNGSTVYIGTGASTPQASLEALVNRSYLQDIQILQMIPGGKLPHLTEDKDQFRTRSFYSFTRTTYYKPSQSSSPDNHQDASSSTAESLADYTPMSVSAVPRLLRERMLTVQVALLKVSLPHKGFVSLGMGVEYTHEFLQYAAVVIAEVSRHVPWTEGRSKIPIHQIDYWIAMDNGNDDDDDDDDSLSRLQTTQELWPSLFGSRDNKAYFLHGGHDDAIVRAIGQNIVQHIPDGATLKFGVSPLSFAVLPFLHTKKNLGLHTDVFIEPLLELQQAGVITNACKTIDKDRTVVTVAHGSHELYDFLDRNPAIEFHPLGYINDPQVMARLDNFISIVGALKVDLTGQVATESIAHKFYGGVWSDRDAVTGARLSKGGKSIVSLPSKSLRGRSNVVFALPAGTGVSITRSDVEYVVTEYGTAYLYGKSIRERCLALIDIAHPDFRAELLEQAKANFYVSISQPGLSFQSKYPQQLECIHTTKKTGRAVLCRPIKAVDEEHLRTFFHKLSDHSVYLRYFRKIKSLPQRILQKTVDVDYVSNMALVVFLPADDTAHHEMVGLAQWIRDDRDDSYEISFQVRDDMQGEGLGTFLFGRLVKAAQEFNLGKLKADVLSDNRPMRKVLEKSGIPFTCKSDFGVVTYRFDLPSATQGNAFDAEMLDLN